jgi:hypothetical protein
MTHLFAALAANDGAAGLFPDLAHSQSLTGQGMMRLDPKDIESLARHESTLWLMRKLNMVLAAKEAAGLVFGPDGRGEPRNLPGTKQCSPSALVNKKR